MLLYVMKLCSGDMGLKDIGGWKGAKVKFGRYGRHSEVRLIGRGVYKAGDEPELLRLIVS